jgi:dienelactone hydrolase
MGAALIVAIFLPLVAAAGEPAKVAPINDRLKKDIASAPLTIRFKGTTAEECRAWQTQFAAKLKSLLGPHAPPTKWTTTVVSVKEFDDHRREELLLSAEGHPPLPIYLLTPKERKGKLPAILAIHGHGSHGHHPVAGRDDLPGVGNAIKNNHYDYGRQFVRQGYVVAVPCLTPFGDRLGKWGGKTDPCADVFIRMQTLGKTLMGENLRDCLWAIELLARHDAVDADRLGCVGLSYGGRMTMLTTALEPRVKVCVISGALNAMQERVSKPYSCGAQIIPGLLQYGDVPEIASLIAPRTCVWEVGSEDKLIDPLWADEILLRQRRAYKALDAADRLVIDRFEGGHVWHGKTAAVVLRDVLRK